MPSPGLTGGRVEAVGFDSNIDEGSEVSLQDTGIESFWLGDGFRDSIDLLDLTPPGLAHENPHGSSSSSTFSGALAPWVREWLDGI